MCLSLQMFQKCVSTMFKENYVFFTFGGNQGWPRTPADILVGTNSICSYVAEFTMIYLFYCTTDADNR